jgi:membrane glycosyltransferase
MYRPASVSSFARASGAEFRHLVDRDLPPEARLEMPVQDFAASPSLEGTLGPDPILGRRLFLILGCLGIGLFAAREMAMPLTADGMNAWDLMLAALFFGLFAWISFGFLSALAGFWALIGTGPGLPRRLARSRLPVRRTAILVPVYNESIGPVFARLETMATSIEAIGLSHLFDMFVLSDSREQAEPVERSAFRRLRKRVRMAVYYRRRPVNTARKPGNIAEWVQRFGGSYENMIVLDADSLMSGIAMARLAATMEADQRIGLIQTVPALHKARTLFARWHQFASSAYGPVASAGLQWWSGSEATFWGHNAIVRVRAFAESCGLPTLSGREPFGGHIMSHDMVEAALLRRRGWSVHMISLPDGSYEECPPTLPDHALRDRRWCQGNLQHLRLIDAAGFHWVSRLQLLMGASAYLTSPLWLLLLMANLIEPFRAGLTRWVIMPSGWLLVLTMILLFGPKLLALAWLSVDHRLRASLGGTRRVAASVAIEIPLSVLVAPLTMLTQTLAIIDIVRGRPSGWAPQRREADGMAFADAWPRYRVHVALGSIFWLAILAGVDGALWTLPVAISLIAAPWLAMFSARVDLGDRLAARGLLLAPGESHDRVQHFEAIHPVPRWAELLRTPSDHRLLNP